MKLDPGRPEDDVVYVYSDDEEGKAFLVHGFHGEGEWCCDVLGPNGLVSRAWKGK